MKNSTKEHIDISEQEKRFKQHLGLPYNSRIIFSGRFGTGKTYFLQKVFEDDDEYFAIRLAPVNYSVSSNDDIFELIKYDLLLSIISHPDFDHEDFDRKFELSATQKLYIAIGELDNSVYDIFNVFFKKTNIGKGVKSLEIIYNTILSIKSKIDDVQSATDKKTIFDYTKEVSEDISLLEFDLISSLIVDMIQNIKKEKATILIIDDLDRVDPTHIFRILNIFSAHLDFWSNYRDESRKEKFGFDKVCMVCDIENIRNIYASNFGIKTDFSGYIDKFYSYEVFRFDNRDVLRSLIINFLKSINLDDGLLAKINKKRFLNNGTIKELLVIFISVGGLNIRHLSSKKGKIWSPSVKYYPPYGMNWQFDNILLYEFFIWLIGDKDALEIILKNSCEEGIDELINTEGATYFLPSSLLFTEFNKHRLNTVEKHKLEGPQPHRRVIVNYEISSGIVGRDHSYYITCSKASLEIIDPLKLFYEAFITLKSLF